MEHRRLTTRPSAEQNVDQTVSNRLKEYPYGFVFRKVGWRFEDGVLTLHGSVPSFYLKQVLQELLRGVDCVSRLENDVDVVSSNGLSSTRPTRG